MYLSKTLRSRLEGPLNENIMIQWKITFIRNTVTAAETIVPRLAYHTMVGNGIDTAASRSIIRKQSVQ